MQSIEPRSPGPSLPQLMEEAVRHQVQGRVREAKGVFEQILARWPENADAMNLLGVIRFRLGERAAGLEMIRKSIALQPNNAVHYCNLAYVLVHGGDPWGAITAYRTAIELNPGFYEARYSLGLALFQCGQIESAIEEYHGALKIRPTAFAALHNLGIALRHQGKFAESIEVLNRALAARANDYDAMHELAITLQNSGKLDEAMTLLKKAIATKGAEAAAYNTLGGVFMMKGQPDEAIAAIEKSIELAPKEGAFRCNLASVLKDSGRLERAAESYAAALSLDPHDAKIHSNWVYVMHFLPQYDARKIFEEARRWNARHALPLARERKPHPNDRAAQRRIKVGLVSPDFRRHPIGRSLIPLLRHYDRDRFEIVCYSNVVRGDDVTAQLKRFADGWRETVGMSQARLCEMVRGDTVDVLFDLTLHMSGNRLLAFAAKPAPVQITWAGYPGTTGLDAMDYRLTDPHLDPEGGIGTVLFGKIAAAGEQFLVSGSGDAGRAGCPRRK